MILSTAKSLSYLGTKIGSRSNEGQHPAFFNRLAHTGTTLSHLPLDSVRCRFQITRLFPGSRNHVSQGSGVARPFETVEGGRDVRRGATTQLPPPLHDLSVHHSFPFFPVFPILERGGSHGNIASARHPWDAESTGLLSSSGRLTILSHHGADRLMTDTEVGGQRAETPGRSQSADRGLLVGT